MITKKKAREILLAHACCSFTNTSNNLCIECPWNRKKNCDLSVINEDVIIEAIRTLERVGSVRTIKLSDIKIQKCFEETTPTKEKMDECRWNWDNYHRQDRYIVVNQEGYLIDGYVQYLILKERNVEEAEIKISNRRKKRWDRKNTKDWNIPHYRNEDTTYVYGKHCNTIKEEHSNEFVWRVPKSWSEQGWENGLNKGDEILVDTKYGVKKITVTRIEKSNKCPIDTHVRRVVKRISN